MKTEPTVLFPLAALNALHEDALRFRFLQGCAVGDGEGSDECRYWTIPGWGIVKAKTFREAVDNARATALENLHQRMEHMKHVMQYNEERGTSAMTPTTQQSFLDRP